MYCRNCGAIMDEQAIICIKCGAKKGSGTEFCSYCGAKTEKNQIACMSCGRAITKERVDIKEFVREKKKAFTITSVLVAIVVLAIILLPILTNLANSVDFQKLYDTHCKSTWARVGDDGSFLSIDTNPYDWDDDGLAYYVAYEAIENINRELGLPTSLEEDMLQTTWSMGKQQEIYEKVGITVSWTYHPDKGLEVTYKLIEK